MDRSTSSKTLRAAYTYILQNFSPPRARSLLPRSSLALSTLVPRRKQAAAGLNRTRAPCRVHPKDWWQRPSCSAPRGPSCQPPAPNPRFKDRDPGHVAPALLASQLSPSMTSLLICGLRCHLCHAICHGLNTAHRTTPHNTAVVHQGVLPSAEPCDHA